MLRAAACERALVAGAARARVGSQREPRAEHAVRGALADVEAGARARPAWRVVSPRTSASKRSMPPRGGDAREVLEQQRADAAPLVRVGHGQRELGPLRRLRASARSGSSGRRR